MLPRSGASSPLRMRKNVVFPAPFGPTIATRSPRVNVALTPANSVRS